MMNVHDLYEQRNNFFLSPSSTARGGLYLAIVIGVVAFAGGMVSGDGVRVWGSFLFNLFFFFSIALGGIAFAAMQDLIGAKWGRPIIRIHESFASFLPVAIGAFVIFLLCIQFGVGRADEVYIWVNDPAMLDHFWGKKSWLQPGFMVARDIFALVLIGALALWQLKIKLGRDGALMNGEKEKALELGLSGRDKLRHWSAPILVIYALTFSLLAFDLTMSLSPLWFSTLWGGWSFAIMMQTLMATILLVMFSLKETPLGQIYGRQQFHDIGKLMHGFTIFFAYLTYAHVLTYWYGNVPEETEYFLHRMHQPWLTIVIVAPILVFVFPLFALIPKAAKWTPTFTIPISITILFSQWLVYLLVVMPETVREGWGIPWIEVGCFLGFLGLFLASVFWFGKRYPMLAVADPLLGEALQGDDH